MSEDLLKKEVVSENRFSGERIRELLVYLGLSQAVFAKMLNLSTSHISRLERGIVYPSDAAIDRICEVFCVDSLYFDGGMNISSAVTKDQNTGQRLKAAREAKGWTQQQIADAVGLLQPTICRLESGSKLTERQGRRLALALECGYEWLMDGDESKRDNPVDERLINWLWDNPDVRSELWERMRATLTSGEMNSSFELKKPL